MKHNFKKITMALLCLSIISLLIPLGILADNPRETLDDIESERRERIEKQLLLDLPEISDNPSHIITFRDPSGEGIELEIDGQGFEEITSPYTLPSLGLGRHTLTFKFTDEEETEQTLERTLTIIPRAPIINPPQIEEDAIHINGNAMPGADVELFLNNRSYNKRAIASVESDGTWKYTFNEEIKEGTYTLIGITRSRGFASNYSEPLVFSIETDSPEQEDSQEKEIYFAFREISLGDLKGTLAAFKANPDLVILLLGMMFLGFSIGWICLSIINRIIQRKSKKALKEKLNKKKPTIDNSSTFRDKIEDLRKNKEGNAENFEDKFFEEDILEEKTEEEEKVEKFEEEIKDDEPPLETSLDVITEESEEETKEESKKKTKNKDKKMSSKTKNVEKSVAISKEEFLEKYKDFDPDDEDGKEGKKKNIKISLTSKD